MDKTDRSASSAAAAGSVTIGGKLYLVGQPTEQDGMTIAVFLRKRAKTRAARIQEDPDWKYLSADDQAAMLAKAARDKFSNDEPFDPYAVMDLLASPEGVRFMAFVLLRKHQPELTFEELAPHVTEENAFRLYVELNAASGMEALGNLVGRAGSQPTGS